MSRVAILGLGLMGASLGLALKKRGDCVVSSYARRAETRDAALRDGVADEAHDDPAAAVRGAEVVVVCGPIQVIPEIVEACGPGLAENAIVTDVGSTKRALAETIPALLAETSATFIGSHPVAGSEKRGLEAAIADLYEGALVVVTPSSDSDEEAVNSLKAFWTELGSRVHLMSPEAHDAVLARTSHLPHLAATLLALTVGRDVEGDTSHFCGTGFKDTSRLAAGSPEIWRDIVQTNQAEICEELEAYGEALEDLLRACRAGDFGRVEALLEQGREVREDLLKGRASFMDGESS